MHKQTKYNRKNKELISQKAKDKYYLQRATEEGKAKASLYAKEKQRRYRERLKAIKETTSQISDESLKVVQKSEQASYPDPTANKESRGGNWNWVKGFEGFYRVYDDNYYGFGGWLLSQERRVDADGNRIKNYKKLTPIAMQEHSRYVKLIDANFKSVYVKWSDIIEHYESINGKSTFNHYEDNINNRYADNIDAAEKTKELKEEYNIDGTSKIIQRIELEILSEEKTLGRKLTIDEELDIESQMKFHIRLEKYN